VARELAADHSVTLLERDNIAAGATGLSAGLVAPTLFYSDRPAIADYANKFFRQFDGVNEFKFHERDRLDFVRPTDRNEVKETVSSLANEGFPVAYLDASAVTDQYPQFDLDGFAGAVRYGDTGWVDPYTYANAVQSAAEDAGATVETDVTVTEVTRDKSDVTGVKTKENGHYSAKTVVVAAGWQTSQILPNGVTVPVRPYRTQCIVLSPKSSLSDDSS
jgi:glycine/D-amino acid oxidase-like deaminating enzyme